MPLDLEHKVEKLEKSAGARKGIWFLILPLFRSRYFLISLGLYLSLLMILAGYKISSYISNSGLMEGTVLVMPPVKSPPPPMPKQQPKAKTPEIKVPQSASAAKNAVPRITVAVPGEFIHKETINVIPMKEMVKVKMPTDMNEKIKLAHIEHIKKVAEFQDPWIVTEEGPRTRAKFTVFQAKYLDGDWNCNPASLENMMLQIRAWSKDRIDAQLVPEVLDIGTDKIFTLHPPFVYLTGHKNFRLADNEVNNLRAYLNMGGAIWGDNALAGRHSRFDIAFRREMKRVLPDRDFKIVPESHAIFSTFFDNIGLPTGMNNYQEPVEMINIGGKLAVLYSLNGYGHFWEARLNRDGKINYGVINLAARGQKPKWKYVYGPHVSGAENRIIYRGMTDETTRNAYKFGINVVVHLLTRYQNDIKLLPKELPAGPDMRNRTSRSQATNVNGGATNAPPDEDKVRKPGVRRITTTRSDRNF